ncbi:hypothetical protein, partial [Vaccinium witches'-broom phytoplasma]|uniref:hypothetical protein n=1 Tax=Vaccinium witches'-broom phytoplasma TaxID=85642 RepID=UPI00056F0BB5
MFFIREILHNMGFNSFKNITVKQLKDAGWGAYYVIALGCYNLRDLIEAGFTIDEIIEAHYTIDNLIQAK